MKVLNGGAADGRVEKTRGGGGGGTGKWRKVGGRTRGDGGVCMEK